MKYKYIIFSLYPHLSFSLFITLFTVTLFPKVSWFLSSDLRFCSDLFPPSSKMPYFSSPHQSKPLLSFSHLVPPPQPLSLINISAPAILLSSPLVSFTPSLHLYLPCSERLSATPLRVCELLSLNDFLLPPPVNSAPFDQANEIENFHLSQIDFKPEITRGPKEKLQKQGKNGRTSPSLNTK